MAGEELQVVRLRDDFYRDGFYKVILALATIFIAIGFLVAISVYIYLSKPAPVAFAADNEWRIIAPVPVDQQYLPTADLIQWFAEVMPKAFTYDFVSYPSQLKNLSQYFTPNGWKKFLDQISVYASADNVQNGKLFLSGASSGAPFILNQGMLQGRYSWWVQMPIDINYVSVEKSYTVPVTIQALVVRISTLNNLYGVAIENIIMTGQGGGSQIRANG